MVPSKPGVLPPGYLSLDDALDRIDPGLLRDKGSNQERQQFENYISSNMAAIIATHTVPEPIYREGVRRVRRKSAFQRLSALCAFGKVPSALLLDDFTVRVGLPAKYWLDERFSTDTCATGRALVTEPWSQYARPGPSGWVIVDAAALDEALLTGSAQETPCKDLPQAAKMLRNTPKGCALIHEAIKAIFTLAQAQTIKPPNVKEVIKPVQNWLQTYRGSTAPGDLIQKLAGDKRYDDNRGKRGATVAGKLRPVRDLKI